MMTAITNTSKLTSILDNADYIYQNDKINYNNSVFNNFNITNVFNNSYSNNNLRIRYLTTSNTSVNTATTTTTNINSKVKIILSSTKKCVTTSASLHDYSYLSFSDCNDTSLSQKFEMSSFDALTSSLQIKSTVNTNYIITESPLSANISTVPIYVYHGNTTDNQDFYFIKNPSSQNDDFFISSVTTGKCIESATSQDGTVGLVMNPCQSYAQAANQLFFISKKCEGNLYLEDDKCVAQCKFGYFPNEVDKTCDKCTLFIKKFVTPNICIKDCGFNFKNDLENGFKICRQCSDELYYFNNNCVKKCDPGYIFDDKKNCVACPSVNNFNYENKCVEECPEYTAKDIIGKTCTNCNKLSPPKKWYKGTCQDNVAVFATKVNTEFNAYSDCGTSGISYTYNSVCIEKCPPQTAVYPGQTICYAYIELKKFNFNETIVDKCPTSYIANEYNKCVPCKYNKDKVCLLNCPKNEVPDSNNVCYDCRDTNKYYYNNICYDSCPFPYSVDTYTYYNTTSNICNNCRDDKKYISKETNSCTTSCQAGYLPHPVTSICLSCKEFGRVVYQGQCALFCPAGTTNDLVTNTCLESNNT